MGSEGIPHKAMSMTFAHPLVCAFAVLLLMVSHHPLQAQETLEATAFDVGKSMPFHIVKFVRNHAGQGCPSVMIANFGNRGLIIWARGENKASVEMAEKLESLKLNGDFQQYLVAFDGVEESLIEKTGGLKQVVVGIPRRSAAEEFASHKIADDVAVVVVLLDKKVIKSSWALKADELTPDKMKEITEATQAFAKEGK